MILATLKSLIFLFSNVTCTFYSDMNSTNLLIKQDDEFKTLKLRNDMIVLLIHNPNFIDSSINIKIDAGHIYSDADFGMQSHLVEHLFIQRSDDYPARDTWLKYFAINRNENFITTSFENINISITLPNQLWIKAVEWMASSLSNAMFTEEITKLELKILDEEYFVRYHNTTCCAQDLFNFAFDESLPESRNIYVRADKVDYTDINENAKRFYQKYFTGERMMMVMASNMKLEELEIYAQRFNIVKRGKLKKNIKITKLKMKFNEKYLVESLVQSPIKGEMLKKEFQGGLVWFYSINCEKIFYIRIIFPSLADMFVYKPLEYIKEVLIGDMRDPLKDKLIEKKLIQSLSVFIHESRRVTYLILQFNCALNCEIEKVQETIKLLYEWVISHEPNFKIHEYLKKKANILYTDPKSSKCAALKHIEHMYLHRQFDANYVDTVYTFSEDVITKMFEYIKNINNWTVYVGASSDKELTRTLYDGIFKYSDPISIKDTVQDVTVNLEYNALEKKIPEIINVPDTSDSRLSFLNFIKKTKGQMMIQHKRFTNGEYTLLESDKVFDQECLVMLNFIFNSDRVNIINAEIFFTFLKIRIPEILKEKNIDIQTEVNNLNYNNLSILIQGKAANAVTASKIVGDLFKYLKLNLEEIQQAKNQLQNVHSLSRFESPIEISRELFRCFIKHSKLYYKEDLKNATGELPKEFYLDIKTYGKVNENEIIQIYENCKSEIDENISPDYTIDVDKDEFIYYTNNPKVSCQIVILGYEVNSSLSLLHNIENPIPEDTSACLESVNPDNRNLLEDYIIGRFLELMFRKDIMEFFRFKTQQAYISSVVLQYINRKFFLNFSIISTSTIDEIKSLFFEQFIKNHAEIISKTEQEYFDDIKCSVLESIVNYEDVDNFDLGFHLYAVLFAQHGNSLFDVLKEEVKTMTKEKLLSHDIFKSAPVFVSGQGTYEQ